jgi:biopolymer transport protein ExbD
MKFSSRKTEEIDINVTSLIDVVLLLLIFFMVSTRFVEHSQLKLTLPSASAAASGQTPEVIEVAIDHQAQFYVGGKALVNGQVDTLVQALREAAGSGNEPTVVISADRDTNFQRIVDVMDAAGKAGLSHVSFPTKVRESE